MVGPCLVPGPKVGTGGTRLGSSMGLQVTSEWQTTQTEGRAALMSLIKTREVQQPQMYAFEAV
jgi:hypothetical protein